MRSTIEVRVTPAEAGAASAAMALGAWVGGGLGFGSALVAAPLLALVDTSFVPGPVTVITTILNLFIIRTADTAAFDRQVRWAVVGLVPGTIAAGATLLALSARGLSIAFAIMVITAVLLTAAGWDVVRRPPTLFGAGVLSGFMGTVSGIGGPPVAILYQHDSGPTLRATLSALLPGRRLHHDGHPRGGWQARGRGAAPSARAGAGHARGSRRLTVARRTRGPSNGATVRTAAVDRRRSERLGQGAAVTALGMAGVGLVRESTVILDGIDWTVRDGERWIVLGANGSGKTTLLRIASLYLHPSTGTVEVLGETLGRVDVRVHRRNIGMVSSSFADLLRPSISALDVVMTAEHAALEPWWHEYADGDRDRALGLLDRFGCGRWPTIRSGHCPRANASGSNWRATLMTDPGLLLLDEPTAGLDLAGREDLVTRLAGLAADPATPATVLVTHHVDEIPPGSATCCSCKAAGCSRRAP